LATVHALKVYRHRNIELVTDSRPLKLAAEKGDSKSRMVYALVRALNGIVVHWCRSAQNYSDVPSRYLDDVIQRVYKYRTEGTSKVKLLDKIDNGYGFICCDNKGGKEAKP
jgi:hypothetical protein